LVFFSIPIITNIPFDVDSQGFGFLSLTVKESGSISALSPFYPEVKWVYSPSFFIFTAFISDITMASIPIAMITFSAIVCILILASAYDFGKRIKDREFGILLGISMLAGTWLFSAFLDSHYTIVLGTFFLISFVNFFFRAMKEQTVFNVFISSLALAGIFYTHPDTLFNLLIAFIPFAFTIFFSNEKLNIRKYLKLFVGMPLLSMILVLPYIIHALGILINNSFKHVGFYTSPSNIILIIAFGGLAVPILSLVGFYFAFKNRSAEDVFMITWFIAIIEFSSIGFFEYLFSRLPVNPMSLMYPFGVAWHAPIIPLSFLAAIALYAGYNYSKNKFSWLFNHFKKYLVIIISSIMIILIFCIIFSNGILIFSKRFSLPLYGEFSSKEDVKAMQWIKENTPKDSFILNYPMLTSNNKVVGWFEGHWVPIISERKSAFNRGQPFFFNTDSFDSKKEEYYRVYVDPAAKGSEELIYRNKIDYVIIPQIIENPDAFSEMYRWRDPINIIQQNSHFEDAKYLEEVYNANGAKVFKVKDR
jgi:hypothetical protein